MVFRSFPIPRASRKLLFADIRLQNEEQSKRLRLVLEQDSRVQSFIRCLTILNKKVNRWLLDYPSSLLSIFRLPLHRLFLSHFGFLSLLAGGLKSTLRNIVCSLSLSLRRLHISTSRVYPYVLGSSSTRRRCIFRTFNHGNVIVHPRR
jgi:hypothetical protein